MGLQALLHEVELTPEQAQLRTRFFEATGYGPSDLLSLNYGTKEFLTQNGGHYRITGEGVQHLAGPSPSVEDRWEP